MSEIRRVYRASTGDLNEINRIFAELADRLDQLEGRRGVPKFYEAPQSTTAATDDAELPLYGQITEGLDGKSDVGHTHAAEVITVDPVGGIAADDVQAALLELDTEKSPTTHGHTYGIADITWTKFTAATETLAGATTASNVVDLRTAHDGNIYEATETAGSANSLIVDFTSVDEFKHVRVLGSYDGSASHALTVDLWNWSTSAWDTFGSMQDVFTSTGTIFENHDFFVPDTTNYIGTGGDAGKVRVRFDHPPSAVTNHKWYFDEVALYK